MKKTTALLSIAVLMITMSACGEAPGPASGKTIPAQSETEETSVSASTEEEKQDSGTITAQTQAEETVDYAAAESGKQDSGTTTSQPAGSKARFKQTATIEETVLVDEDGVKVTANALTYSKYAVSLELTIENNRDEDLKIMNSAGTYDCNSINGIMVSGGYFHSEVKAGKKAKESVSFEYDELLLYGIDEIADMELGISSATKDYDYTYYPVSQIKTSAADSYVYDNTGYRKAFTSNEMQSAFGYHILYSAEDILYDVDDVSIVSEALFENKDGDPVILIEAINHSAYQSRLSVEDIFINGINVCESGWTNELINPGKTVMITVNLSDVFHESYWEMFGITEVKNIKLGIGQSDQKGEYESNPETIEISVAGGGSSIDTSGTAAYDDGEVRVIYKGIAGGKSDYDNNLYVMFLVENKSGKTIIMDDVYDSFSINGFMGDSIVYSLNVENDVCAVWEIEIPERILKDIGIKQASDIEEIEFGIVIRDENWENKNEGTVVLKAVTDK